MNSRVILALLKKNNTQPGLGSTLLALGVMLSISVADAIGPLPAYVWLFGMAWMLALGAAAGHGAFSVDLKANNIRFLEYLPIRRRTIWLTDWGDGVLWLVVMVLALTWWRLVNWSPPVPDDRDAIGAIVEHLLFASRWTLPLGLLALAFCGFGAGAFFRLCFERDAAAIMRGVAASVFVVGITWILPGALGLRPGLGDAAVPLLIVGALYSAGSFVLFNYTPAEWGWVRKWAFLRLPILLTLAGLSIAIVAAMCLAWWRLDPDDVVSVAVIGADEPRPDHPLLIQATSARSGDHLLSVDPETGRTHYLGRGLQAWGVEPVGQPTADGELLLSAMVAADGLRPTGGDALIAIRPDGTGRRTLLERAIPFGGRRYRWFGARQVPGTPLLAFTAHPEPVESADADDPVDLFVVDQSGAVLHRFAVDRLSQFSAGPDATLVALAPRASADDPAPDEADAPARLRGATLLLIDARAGDARSVTLPGQVLACAPDLSAVLSLRAEAGDGADRRSLVITDLVTGAERTVIGADQLPPQPRNEWADDEFAGAAMGDLLLEPGGGVRSTRDLRFIVDASFDRLVWWQEPEDRRDRSGTLMITQISTGDTRPLVARDALLPPAATARYGGSVQPRGWTADGAALLVESDRSLFHVAEDGTARLVAGSAQDEYLWWRPSPCGTRAAGVADPPFRRFDGPRAAHPPAPRQVIVSEENERRTIYTSTANLVVRWLDCDRLLVSDGPMLLLLGADGTVLRRLYPPAADEPGARD